MEELVESYLTDQESIGTSSSVVRRDPAFFQSVASVLINARNAKINDVVLVKGEHVTFEKGRVPRQHLAGLGIAAAKSLKMALDLSTPPLQPSSGSISTRIVLYCRWYLNGPLLIFSLFRGASGGGGTGR